MQHPNLAPVLDEDGDLDLLKVGRIEQDHRCERPLSREDNLAHEYLAKHGRWYLVQGARLYGEQLAARTRQNGGTIITERHQWRDGRRTVTRTVERFPAAIVTPRTRPMPRRRGAGRPRAQATRSSAASGDSGDDGPGEPAAPSLLRLPAVEQVAR